MPKKLPVQIISDHRITIPQHYRQKHDLEVGEYVLVSVEPMETDVERLGGQPGD